MKLFSGFRFAATFAFFLLCAASAFAQFEVSPDHFDENTPAPRKADSAKKHQGQINATHGTAATKASQGASATTSRAHRTGKPSPGTRSATKVAAAKAGTKKGRQQTPGSGSASDAPSLKAQASTVPRE